MAVFATVCKSEARRVVEPRTQPLELRVWLARRDAPHKAAQVVEPVPDALRRLHFRVAPQALEVDTSTLGGSR